MPVYPVAMTSSYPSASESRKRRLQELQDTLQKIASDVQDLEADGRIEAADLTRIEQIVASLDEVVSSGLPKTRLVQRKRFGPLTFTWWGRKVPKS